MYNVRMILIMLLNNKYFQGPCRNMNKTICEDLDNKYIYAQIQSK